MAAGSTPLGLRAAWRLGATLRAVRSRASSTAVETLRTDVLSSVGYRIRCVRVRPEGAGPLPGLVVSPAIHQGVDALLGRAAVVSADELARLGFVVMLHDPAGRGESWGEEDYGGLEHQDDLRAACRALAADSACDGRIGVLSLSLGVAAAVGAVARWPDEMRPAWLVDWEGPCDREIITSGGTILVPAAGHTLDDEAYWEPRESVRAAGRLACGYVRLQALPDHAQPTETRHAMRMIRAVEAGKAPWFQINDHARGEAPERPVWARGGPLAANATIIRKLATLRRAMD